MCTQMGAHSPATPHEGGGSQGLGSAGSLAAVRAFWPSSLLLSHCVSGIPFQTSLSSWVLFLAGQYQSTSTILGIIKRYSFAKTKQTTFPWPLDEAAQVQALTWQDISFSIVLFFPHPELFRKPVPKSQKYQHRPLPWRRIPVYNCSLFSRTLKSFKTEKYDFFFCPLCVSIWSTEPSLQSYQTHAGHSGSSFIIVVVRATCTTFVRKDHCVTTQPQIPLRWDAMPQLPFKETKPDL